MTRISINHVRSTMECIVCDSVDLGWEALPIGQVDRGSLTHSPPKDQRKDPSIRRPPKFLALSPARAGLE